MLKAYKKGEIISPPLEVVFENYPISEISLYSYNGLSIHLTQSKDLDMTNKLSAPLDNFKEREIEIIRLMADGLSNKEIAEQLFITKETVRWYNKQIYSKLGTSRRTEAIALAREMNLIGDIPADSAPIQDIRHILPVTTGPFIGRDNDLAELSDLLHTLAIV